MDADEREIFEFLKTYGEEWVSSKEVCRRAGGKRRFAEDPNWAKPVLQQMKDSNLLEMDMAGRYRIRMEDKKHRGRWVSPDIEKILREGGLTDDKKPAETAPDAQPGQS